MMAQLGAVAPPTDGLDEFDACYQAQWWPMVRLAIGLVGDRAAAEDVVQDAFAGLYRRWPDVIPAARVGYLRVSVVNTARSALRRLQTARKHERALVDTHAPSADERLVLASDRDEVWAGLDTLPQRQREVLVLRFVTGLADAEIATATGLSLGGVRSSSSRGLAALRTVMGERQ